MWKNMFNLTLFFKKLNLKQQGDTYHVSDWSVNWDNILEAMVVIIIKIRNAFALWPRNVTAVHPV